MTCAWGITEEAGRNVSQAERSCPIKRRARAQEYKRRFVVPRIQAAEAKWAAAELHRLAGEPYAALVRNPTVPRGWPVTLRWAS